jgi:hypothetical protein
MLQSVASGFGYLALAGLCSEAAAKEAGGAAAKQPHVTPRAKRIIFLFMHGGPSQVDTFDYKPRLQADDGKDLPFEPAMNLDPKTQRKLMRSPWKFQQHGQCGQWVSELFPHVAGHVDDLCLIHSMQTEGQSHGQAVMKLHTGDDTFVRPSVGAWVTYGLGSENQNLPGFVTICPPRGHGGVRNYGSAFLPAQYQGTAIGSAGVPVSSAQIRYIHNDQVPPDLQRKQLDFLQSLNRDHLRRSDDDARIEGVIQSFELAFRMQSAAPKLTDLSDESAETLALYGIGTKETDDFGRQCLLARRCAESGVRYIQVSHSFKWDQHGNLKGGHEKNSKEVDKPIAGLLADLKRRGMLDDTLVLWGGEFGRTPMVEGKDGRDHNPQGFTMWLAGGGVRPGYAHGATDDFGYFAIRDRVHMHDLHATLLHLLGLDHQRLTYRYAGRDFRLTDVYGRVVDEIIV